MWGLLLRLVAVMLLLGACSGRDAVRPSESTTATSDVAARSQGVLDVVVKADEPGCSAAVGVEGRVVWTGVRGVANLTNDAKITTRTVFDIASVSKQFTATAVLLLADAGKLTLDDPLSNHVPGLPAWAATVTVAQLMHHTSGIPDYTELLQAQGYQSSDRTTQAQALQVLATVPNLEFQPGTRFEYSNSNYLLLGEIVQRVSEKPLPQFLSVEIFQPLGLAMVMDPVGNVPDKAVPYEKGTDGYSVDDSGWEQVGDGGIQTTPTELVRWADNYRTGNVGGTKLLDAQLAGAVETEPGSGERYGAGISVFADGTLGHDGEWAGFDTAFRISKDRRTSAAISCNTNEEQLDDMIDGLGRLWM